jgi:hypothetical protein
MNALGKVVAWVCIFSTLFMGCYSAVIMEPTGEGKEKIQSERIFYVVTRDSVRYDFETRPTVVRDTIAGEWQMPVEGGFIKKHCAIPMSEVAYVSVKKSDPETTGMVLGIAAAAVLLIVLSQMKTGSFDMDWGASP